MNAMFSCFSTTFFLMSEWSCDCVIFVLIISISIYFFIQRFQCFINIFFIVIYS